MVYFVPGSMLYTKGRERILHKKVAAQINVKKLIFKKVIPLISWLHAHIRTGKYLCIPPHPPKKSIT
jgi:hypothetical protein